MTSSKEALDYVTSDVFTGGNSILKAEAKVCKNIILQDLERLEEYDKALNQRCANCPNKEGNICVGMNAPIGIEALLNCKEMMIYDCQMSLEELEKENQELKELQELNKKALWNLKQENQKLDKALDVACKILNWDCPVSQELIEDLDCENRCNNCDDRYEECWRKYLLEEVLENE